MVYLLHNWKHSQKYRSCLQVIINQKRIITQNFSKQNDIGIHREI